MFFEQVPREVKLYSPSDPAQILERLFGRVYRLETPSMPQEDFREK